MKAMFLKLSITVLFFFYISLSVNSQPNLLTSKYSISFLKSAFQTNNSWRLFPSYKDRSSWVYDNKINNYYSDLGASASNYSWQKLSTNLYNQFAETGNRSEFESPYVEKRSMLGNLIIAELLQGNGKYFPSIVNGIQSILQEPTWIIPAHAKLTALSADGGTESIVDLYTSETASLLALADYFFRNELDNTSPGISKKIEDAINSRFLNLIMSSNNFSWMGFDKSNLNNWTPWITSNWILCDLIIDKDLNNSSKSVYKALQCLDNYLNQYPQDGTCREGISYWSQATGSLTDALEILYRRTNGAFNIFSEPIIKNMGSYIYKMNISKNYFFNYGDASSIPNPPVATIYDIGLRTGSKELLDFSSYLLSNNDFAFFSRASKSWFYRRLYSLSVYNKIASLNSSTQSFRHLNEWLPSSQIFIMRESVQDNTGLYVSGKAGNNGSSHHHNDVGNYIIYDQGKPFIVDIGVGVYDKSTFGKNRNKLAVTQSQYHNLPTINGTMQSDGSNFAAGNVSFNDDGSNGVFKEDIASAYPAAAKVSSWARSISLNRTKHEVDISENFRLSHSGDKTFISLITPCNASINGNVITLTSPDDSATKLFLEFNSQQFTPSVENILLQDSKLSNSWSKGLNRIILTLNNPNATSLQYNFHL